MAVVDIVTRYADGRMIVRTPTTGALGACDVCERDEPGLYLTGGDRFLCQEHAVEGGELDGGAL